MATTAAYTKKLTVPGIDLAVAAVIDYDRAAWYANHRLRGV